MSNKLDFLEKVDGFQPEFEFATVKSCNDANAPNKKRYFIEFKYYDAKSGKLKPKQMRVPYDFSHTAKSAKHFAQPIIIEANNLLNKGYHKPDKSKPEKPKLLLSDAIKMYYDWTCAVFKSVKDYNTMFGEKGLFTVYVKKKLAGVGVGEITRTDILGIIDFLQSERRWKNTTRNSRLYRLSGLFEYLLERNYIKDNPTRGISKLKESTRHYRPFMGSQIPLLKSEIKKNDKVLYLIVSIMYYTMARPEEILKARVSHIDLTNDRFFIPNDASKNGTGDYVDIPPRLKEIFLEYKVMSMPSDFYLIGEGLTEPSNKKAGYEKLREVHGRYLNKFGLKGSHHLYSWKVTGFCQYYYQKKDIKALQRQARHSDVKITDIYLSYYNLHEHELVDFE